MTPCTMEDSLLDFFYGGLSPWIQSHGYRWSREEDYIARKFLRFSYELHCVLLEGLKMDLVYPCPMHRDLPEDLDTFEMYTSSSFLDFLEPWKFLKELVGTRLESCILDFCYVWINVTAGKPGAWTQVTLDINEGLGSDDEQNDSLLADGNAGRRKYDLY